MECSFALARVSHYKEVARSPHSLLHSWYQAQQISACWPSGGWRTSLYILISTFQKQANKVLFIPFLRGETMNWLESIACIKSNFKHRWLREKMFECPLSASFIFYNYLCDLSNQVRESLLIFRSTGTTFTLYGSQWYCL